MSGITFSLDANSLPNKPLDNPDVGPDLIAATAAFDGEQNLGGVSFGFGANLSASVAAYNSKDDEDVDGVLGVTKEDKPFQVTLPPQIEFNEENAWLKYRWVAAIKGSVSAKPVPFEVKFTGSKQAIFTDFHVHARNDNTIKAVATDLTRLRFAANVDDIMKLSEKEALSYQVQGQLSASVTLAWSDILATGVGALSGLLSAGTLLDLKVSAAASINFSVKLEDDFRLVFTRPSDKQIKVALKKTKSRQVGVGAKIGITVSFANPAELQKALGSLVESVAGVPTKAIDDILAKATFADLTDDEKRILEELRKRLGLEKPFEKIEELKEKWEALKQDVQDKIESVAKAKVELGFTYDYLRMHVDDSLLIAELQPATLAEFHNDLMLCNFARLQDRLHTDPNSGRLLRYLHQVTDIRSHAFGFSLGVGKFNVGGKDQIKLTRVVQENESNEERFAYQGIRQYDGKWLDDAAGWKMDFKAQLETFKPAGTATTDQFKYGLFYRWEWQEKKLTRNELERYLDNAVLWRIIGPDQMKTILNSMEKVYGNTAQVTQELTIDDKILRKLLPLATAAFDTDLPARIFAKAMPAVDKFEARRSPAIRELLYASLWQTYFREDDIPIGDFPNMASRTVEKIAKLNHIAGGQELANLERIGRGSGSEKPFQDPRTFAGQLFVNGNSAASDFTGVHRNWNSFVSGIQDLNTAIKSGHEHREIEDIFVALSKFAGQSLFIRAAGTFLVDIAAQDFQLLSEIERNFSIKSGDDTFIFKAGGA